MGTVPDANVEEIAEGGVASGAFSDHDMRELSPVAHIEACWVLSGFSPDDSGKPVRGY